MQIARLPFLVSLFFLFSPRPLWRVIIAALVLAPNSKRAPVGARIKVGAARRGMVPLVRAGRRRCEFAPQRAGRCNAVRVREVRVVRDGRRRRRWRRRAAGASACASCPPFLCAT